MHVQVRVELQMLENLPLLLMFQALVRIFPAVAGVTTSCFFNRLYVANMPSKNFVCVAFENIGIWFEPVVGYVDLHMNTKYCSSISMHQRR